MWVGVFRWVGVCVYVCVGVGVCMHVGVGGCGMKVERSLVQTLLDALSHFM